MQYAVLAVGAPCPIPTVSGTPLYDVFGTQKLVLPSAGWKAPEIHQICFRHAEFALAVFGPLGVLLFRFGDLPWSDAVFNIWNGGRARSYVGALDTEPIPAASGHLLTIVPVETRNNTVLGIRCVVLSNAFTNAIQNVLRDQVANGPISDPEFFERGRELYARYPQSKSMLRSIVARTSAGAA